MLRDCFQRASTRDSRCASWILNPVIVLCLVCLRNTIFESAFPAQNTGKKNRTTENRSMGINADSRASAWARAGKAASRKCTTLQVTDSFC